MKTLRNYIVNGALLQADTGPEAQVGDQVQLYLDQDAHPSFPDYIVGTIQHPITKVNCDTATSYSIEYDEADLLGIVANLVVADVVDGVVVTAVEVLDAALAAETAARIAADLLLAPKASPTFTGTPLAPTATVGTNNTQLATTAFVVANTNRFLNATQGIYQKLVISGTAGNEIITIENV